jgi:hypothetical protein
MSAVAMAGCKNDSCTINKEQCYDIFLRNCTSFTHTLIGGAVTFHRQGW